MLEPPARRDAARRKAEKGQGPRERSSMEKILITGAGGQLGQTLVRALETGRTALGPVEARGAEVRALRRGDLDVGDAQAVRGCIRAYAPRVVIHCAAHTGVDLCEAEPQRAMEINALGSRNVAIAAQESGAVMVHVSTDYVFSGNQRVPYREWDGRDPASVYGKSKALAEDYVRDFCRRYFIVRTAWLYGLTGENFVRTILRLSGERDSIRVVDDQRGCPTYAEDLAHHLLQLSKTEEYGIYHITGGGECTWYDFAREIVRRSASACRVEACRTEEFPRPAPRPAYSVLDHQMLRATLGDRMRDWQAALTDFWQSAFGREGRE